MGLDHRHSLLTMTAPSLPTSVQIQAKATSPRLGRGGYSLSHLPRSRSDVLCKASLCGVVDFVSLSEGLPGKQKSVRR